MNIRQRLEKFLIVTTRGQVLASSSGSSGSSGSSVQWVQWVQWVEDRNVAWDTTLPRTAPHGGGQEPYFTQDGTSWRTGISPGSTPHVNTVWLRNAVVEALHRNERVSSLAWNKLLSLYAQVTWAPSIGSKKLTTKKKIFTSLIMVGHFSIISLATGRMSGHKASTRI